MKRARNHIDRSVLSLPHLDLQVYLAAIMFVESTETKRGCRPVQPEDLADVLDLDAQVAAQAADRLLAEGLFVELDGGLLPVALAPVAAARRLRRASSAPAALTQAIVTGHFGHKSQVLHPEQSGIEGESGEVGKLATTTQEVDRGHVFYNTTTQHAEAPVNTPVSSHSQASPVGSGGTQQVSSADVLVGSSIPPVGSEGGNQRGGRRAGQVGLFAEPPDPRVEAAVTDWLSLGDPFAKLTKDRLQEVALRVVGLCAHVDLAYTSRKIAAWWTANPKKRPRTDYARFIAAWFMRDEDKCRKDAASNGSSQQNGYNPIWDR